MLYFLYEIVLGLFKKYQEIEEISLDFYSVFQYNEMYSIIIIVNIMLKENYSIFQ